MTLTVYCTRCGVPLQIGSSFCAKCGLPLSSAIPDPQQWKAAGAQVPGVAPFAASLHEAQSTDSTGGLIPYKNANALAAYYAGVFGIALAPLAILAIVLGVRGYQAYREKPVIRGAAHAWAGIILGSLTLLFWLVLLILFLTH